MTVAQYDCTSAAGIPLTPGKFDPKLNAVLSYMDARFAGGWLSCIHRYPELARIEHVVSTATQLSSIARVMDIEPGNPTKAAQLPGWVKRMIAHGVYKPGGYADRADMPALEQAMAASGLARHEYSLGLAAPGISVAHALELLKRYDWVQLAFAGRFDKSLARDDFYRPQAKPHPPAPKPKPAQTKASGQASFAGTVDFDTGLWTVHGTPNPAAHFGSGPEHWSAEIQVHNHDGTWRVWGLPFNAPPLK